MYIEYDDILTRVTDKPLWWHSGLPRFEPFRPEDVGVHTREVALVHTECQDCGAKYDVAIQPRGYGRDLRSMIAYQNSLEVGDPPNACHNSVGNFRCTGTVMGSIEIAILEFWQRYNVRGGWQRDRSLERPLAGADWHETGQVVPPESVLSRIHRSERRADWLKALQAGNFAEMVAILDHFGCERSAEVAHMLDIRRRERAFVDEISGLRRERFDGA